MFNFNFGNYETILKLLKVGKYLKPTLFCLADGILRYASDICVILNVLFVTIKGTWFLWLPYFF